MNKDVVESIQYCVESYEYSKMPISDYTREFIQYKYEGEPIDFMGGQITSGSTLFIDEELDYRLEGFILVNGDQYELTAT